MAESEASQDKLFTLSEISQKTGISMPTLQRYKKMYQDRIPAEGKGRKQRYPESALPVFDELRNENLGRRGRPRKDPNAPRPERAAKSTRGRKAQPAAKKEATKRAGGRKAAGGTKRQTAAAAPAPTAARGARGRKAAAGSGGGRGTLMTLTQVSEQTGISYPTLVRYVRMHSDRLPHEGKGRARRFYPEAVNVFRELREESGRGGRKPAAAAKRGAAAGRGRAASAPAAAASRAGSGDDAGTNKRLKAIEKAQQVLDKRFRDFAKSLQRLLR